MKIKKKIMYIYEMTILDSKSFYHVDICFICAADKF